MKQRRIVDEFRKIVERTSTRVLPQLQAYNALITAVHYDFGHYTDVREKLKQQAKNPQNNTERYPLIVVFEDFKVDKRRIGIQGVAGLTAIILFTSKKDMTRQQRETQVFIPIIQPIYEAFLVEIKNSGVFKFYGPTPPHTEIDRPHWGDPGLYRNGEYLLGDCLDGKELQFSQLETLLNICVPQSNLQHT